MRVFEQLIGIRKRWIVLGAALLGLVFPAVGLTSQTKQVTERVTSTTVTEKSADGFKFNVRIAQGQPTGYGGRYANEVIINLNKTSGSSIQTNQYTFSKGVKFTGSSSLSSGQFKATFANGYGSLSMSFKGSGSTFTIRTPKGCSGSGGQGHKGTLSGSLTLKAGGKLHTVKVKSISATLSTATYQCAPTPKGLVLYPPATANTGVLASNSGGKVMEEISVTKRGGTAYDILHAYIVKGLPSSDYKSSSMSNATLKGAHGISGTATFKGTHKEGSNKEVGTLSGNLKVTMASIGAVTPLKKSVSGYLQERTG